MVGKRSIYKFRIWKLLLALAVFCVVVGLIVLAAVWH